MSIKDEYIRYRDENNLRTANFEDRVVLQRFLRDHLEDIWSEKPNFTNGGLFKNHMTGFAIGFAYYDCQPSRFCKTRCYGLPIAGLNDYFMLRLAVMTSESLKTEDPRYLEPLSRKLKSLDYLKIGHWGDAAVEQIPVIEKLVRQHAKTTFWWYTRKMQVALEANSRELANLRVYLSLDPSTPYPSRADYPFGITYFFGDNQYHDKHDEILNDPRLVAIFTVKKRAAVEDPELYGVAEHPRMCIEKRSQAEAGRHGNLFCLTCSGRCNFAPR